MNRVKRRKEMKRFLAIAMLFFTTIFFTTACPFLKPKEEGPVQKSNLTFGMVKANVTKGKTTQLEVMELLGAPNMVTTTEKETEKWIYQQVSYQASERKAFGEAFFGGIGGPVGGAGAAGWSGETSESAVGTATLVIYFDSNDVVKDYRMQVSKY